MRYCKRCVLPDTKPGVVFDDEGVCSACRSNEKKRRIDWEDRARMLGKVCSEVRGTNSYGYDCIVPVSGGKDSVYQAWMMRHVYGMKVLGVCIAPHIPTKEGITNLNSMVENVQIDLVKVIVKPGPFRNVRRRCFFEKGEPNWVEHLTVFSGVARVALLYRVPLVVWGEDIAVEYGGKGGTKTEGTAEDLCNNDLIKDSKIEQFLGDDVTEKDIFFYRHPEVAELRKRKIKTIYLGYYDWWDGYRHLLKALEFGFRPREKGPLSGNLIDYDNIDEKLCEINIWFKFLKFGFWRPTDQACYQIWNDRMTRAEAVKLVNEKQYEIPTEYLHEFLEFHKITEKEFWEVVERYRNPKIWERIKGEWRLKVPLE